MAQKQNFSFLADHLSLDFVGTEFRRSGEHQDRLATFESLRDWLKQAGLLASPEAVALVKHCSAKASERVLSASPGTPEVDPVRSRGYRRRKTGTAWPDSRDKQPT